MPPAHGNQGNQENQGNNQYNNRGAGSSDQLNIFINLPLESEFVQQITSIDPRIRPIMAEEGGDDDARLADVEIVFSFSVDDELLRKTPRLRWIQLASAGVDRMVRAGILQAHPDLLVTTASGLHEVPISEHILGMILYFSRGFDKATQNQRLRKWERYRPGETLDETVCIIGYGPIARRAATLCKALGMRALSVRASITEQQPGDGAVERFYPVRDLNHALAESDYIVIAAPRTPLSEGMIGREQFAVMKESAVLINISRGAIVDEEALIEALQQAKIAGAGLDVFTEEPLPESSPLWDMPNVLITPHNAGSNPLYYKRATQIFCDNLAHYLRGEPLHNLVIAERGY